LRGFENFGVLRQRGRDLLDHPFSPGVGDRLAFLPGFFIVAPGRVVFRVNLDLLAVGRPPFHLLDHRCTGEQNVELKRPRFSAFHGGECAFVEGGRLRHPRIRPLCPHANVSLIFPDRYDIPDLAFDFVELLGRFPLHLQLAEERHLLSQAELCVERRLVFRSGFQNRSIVRLDLVCGHGD